jgi:hypothetical protein
MGSSKAPTVAKDPELERQRAEQARINKENEAKQLALKEDQTRKQNQNLIGQASLQDDEMGDFSGYRRKMMGGNKNA